MCLSFCQHLDYCSYRRSWNLAGWFFSHFTLCFQSCFGYFRTFTFLYTFQNKLIRVYKKLCWDLDSNCIKLIYLFGESYLYYVESSIYEHSMFLQLFRFLFIYFIIILLISVYSSCLFLWSNCKWYYLFLHSSYLLLVYKQTINLWIFILYPVTLLNLLVIQVFIDS